MGPMASQITSLTIVYSTVYSGADQRKRQSSASLAFVWGIHQWPVNSPQKCPVTLKMFPFDDVIMWSWLRGSYCNNKTYGHRWSMGLCRSSKWVPLQYMCGTRKALLANLTMHKNISHNAPFCNSNVHISVTKWCIVGCGTRALWDLCNGSIGRLLGTPLQSRSRRNGFYLYRYIRDTDNKIYNAQLMRDESCGRYSRERE